MEWGPALPTARNASRVRCLVIRASPWLAPQAAGAGTVDEGHSRRVRSGQTSSQSQGCRGRRRRAKPAFQPAPRALKTTTASGPKGHAAARPPLGSAHPAYRRQSRPGRPMPVIHAAHSERPLPALRVGSARLADAVCMSVRYPEFVATAVPQCRQTAIRRSRPTTCAGATLVYQDRHRRSLYRR